MWYNRYIKRDWGLNVKYYHMTSLTRLNSICKEGLTPRNEENSKLIGDTKIKVFFSEGFEGAIALFVDFDIVYREIKNGTRKLKDEILENKIKGSKTLQEFLEDGIYLQFDGMNIKNERNFENGCTSETILPEKLNVCVLKNKQNNSIIFSRFEIIKYMMSKIEPKDIKYYGATYSGSPNFDDATKRIQEKVNMYYNTHIKEIEKYKKDSYVLEYIPIAYFVNVYLK